MSRATQLKPGDVSLGQAYEFFKAFVAAGGTNDYLQRAIEDARVMQRMIETFRVIPPSFVYDAKTVCGVLHLPCDCTEEAPKAAPGEVVVWYGGWTLGKLVATDKVVNYLSQGADWKAPAGYYHVRMPVQASNRMTHDQRISLLTRLYATLKELPTPVGATTLATHFGVTGEDLLKGGFCCCAEVLPHGSHAELDLSGGRVGVSYRWGGDPDGRVFLGAARKF